MQIISSVCRQLILFYPSRLALTSPGIISRDYSHAQCQKKMCLKSYADSEGTDQTVRILFAQSDQGIRYPLTYHWTALGGRKCHANQNNYLTMHVQCLYSDRLYTCVV